MAELIEEAEIGALLQAQARGLLFTVTSVERTVTVEGDRQIFSAAVSNLLQNAFKFTRKQTNVSLTARATPDRVLIDVEDEGMRLHPRPTEEAAATPVDSHWREARRFRRRVPSRLTPVIGSP